MAGAISNYLAEALLDHVLGLTSYTPPSTIYAALFTTSPDFDSGSGGTEVSGGSYARVAITNNTTNFPNSTGTSTGVKTTGATITFATPSAGWGTVVSVGFYDAASGGNLLAGGTLTTSRSISSGNSVSFASGSITLTVSGFGFIARALLDLAFGAVSYSPPAPVFLGLFTTNPNAAGSGGVEVSGGSYARLSVTNNTTNFPAATGTTAGSKTNGATFNFVQATANWGTVTGVGLFTASSSGTLILSLPLTSSTAVNSGSIARFNTSNLTVTLD